MSNINIKSILSILAGKITLFISKNLLKGGSTFPGTVALKFDKEILKKVAKGYKVILVTGTNGKTTTTSMITNIFKANGHTVIKFVTEYITPEIITITNLFRDQLDRYGEVYTTLSKILEGVEKVPLSK